MRRSPIRSGFTTIELLVVIAILAILSSLLFPAFLKLRKQARQSVCASNLHQIGVATRMYADDHEGRYPYAINARAKSNSVYSYASPTLIDSLPEYPKLELPPFSGE